MASVTIIEGFDRAATPSTYQLPDGQVIEVLAARAEFDGSGAAGAYIPQISFYAQDGRKLGAFPAPVTIPAGTSVGCTFFPTAPPSSGGGGGGGIQFDQANIGDWLDIETTSTVHTPSVAFQTAGDFSVIDTSGDLLAIELQAQNGGNILIDTTGGGDVQVIADTFKSTGTSRVDLEGSVHAFFGAGGGGLEADTAGVEVTLQGPPVGSVFIVCDTVPGTFGIQVSGNPGQPLGFFGATPSTQPATPVSLADVIALLQGLGLCS